MKNLYPFAFFFASVLVPSCGSDSANGSSKIDNTVQEVDDTVQAACEPIPYLVSESVGHPNYSMYTGFTAVREYNGDLDGDGRNDNIEILISKAKSDALDDFEEYRMILKIDRQFIPLASPITGSIINDQRLFFGKIFDTDKNDRYQEFFLSYWPYSGEDITPFVLVCRYMDGKIYLTGGNKEVLYGEGNIEMETNGEVSLSRHRQLYPNSDAKEYKALGMPTTGCLYVHSRASYSLCGNGIRQARLDILEKELRTCAACPFVYIQRPDGWSFQGEIIRNLVGPGAEQWQELRLSPLGKGEHILRVAEEKRETSYINALEILADGVPVDYVLLGRDGAEMQCDDARYQRMAFGDVLDIRFTLAQPARDIRVKAKGYYVPDPMF